MLPARIYQVEIVIDSGNSDDKDMVDRQIRMLIVGAFPAQDLGVHGGILTSCRVLLASSLPQRADLILVDSSSPTVPPPPFISRLLRACTRVIVAARHILFSRPDVALLFASPGASFVEKSLMCGIARLVGIRTLMFPRGAEIITQYDSSFLYRNVYRVCFRVPHIMLCQGRAYHDFFKRRIGIADDRCPVLENWTATPPLLEIGADRTPRDDGAPVEVLFLGWVAREKGIYELLECARRLAELQDIPPFRLSIAGEGAALLDTKRLVAEGGLNEVVRFLGWVDDEAKLERLRVAGMLVLPSYIEGMPNALIEAMAAGLPVIATNVGAVRDVVTDGSNGLIVEAKDTDGLFDALLRLIGDDKLRDRMGRAGYQIAAEKFATERAVDRLLLLAGAGERAQSCKNVGGQPQ